MGNQKLNQLNQTTFVFKNFIKKNSNTKFTYRK